MAYFNQDYLDFFKELEQHNNKAWFDENRKRYEQSVKDPFKAFTTDLIEASKAIFPTLNMEPKHAIKRINRDIRFSKDKTPYKIHMSAGISAYERKDYSKPGIWVQANHVDVRVYAGIFALDKEQLMDVRYHMADHLDEFKKLQNEKKFKSTFGEILGDKNKRLPSQFSDIQDKEPLLFNKSFYYYFKLDSKILLQDNLVKELLDRYKHCLPVNQFFLDAIG